jgi:hypothetical protein
MSLNKFGFHAPIPSGAILRPKLRNVLGYQGLFPEAMIEVTRGCDNRHHG